MILIKKLLQNIPRENVREVIVGVFSTLVKTDSGCGIASTLRYDRPHQRIVNSGELEQMNLRELAELALSENLLEASVGMAAINSTLPSDAPYYREMNGTELILEKGAGKTLGIIGHFPFLERVSDQFEKVYVFEKFPQHGDLREEDIPALLPQADVVAITATSVTNHTFGDIMHWAAPHSYKLLLGPSTTLSPLFFEWGVDALAGSVVVDYEKLRKQVIQATPTRYLSGIRQVCLLRKDFP